MKQNSQIRRLVRQVPAGFFLLCALLPTPAAAQQSLPAWQAVHAQRPGTILLLGSIHLLRASDHPLPPLVDEVYAQADNIVFEIDLDDLDPAQIQTQFMGAAMLANGTSLRDVLEPQLYTLASRQAQDLVIDLQLLSRFEPWFVATMLMSIGLSRQGVRPTSTIFASTTHATPRRIVSTSGSSGITFFGVLN